MAASIAFQASAASTSGSSTYTFPLTVASAAGQERLVAVGFITNGTPTNLTFSMTVDGQTATEVLKVARAGSGDGTVMILYRAPGTSGTSINVVVTLTTGGNYGAHCALWTLSDAGTLFASTTSVLDDPTLDVNTPASGVLVAGGFAFGSGGTSAWTGATEREDAVVVYDAIGTFADATTTAETPRAVSIAWSISHGERASFAAAFNPSITGTTLTAAAGSYALTGTAAGLNATANLTFPAAAGAYALTGAAATFIAGGNYTLFCNPGSYTLSGANASFPGYDTAPPVQPSTGGGYTGGAVYDTYRLRKKRKRDEIEELIDAIQAPAPVRTDRPTVPPPPPPALIDMKMQAVGLTPPQRKIVKRAIVSDDDDDDAEAIELLLNLLS